MLMDSGGFSHYVGKGTVEPVVEHRVEPRRVTRSMMMKTVRMVAGNNGVDDSTSR